MLSVAISRVYGSALAGRSKGRAELADTAIPLEATLSVLPCRGGEEFLRKLFEPLGYEVAARGYPLDEKFPEWGDSRYFTVRLRNELRLRDLLSHIYVLVPVLDNEKHYWVGDDEVEKLLRHGAGWLGDHPEKEAIAYRYLKYRRSLAREALARLVDEEMPDPDSTVEAKDSDEEAIERPINLNEQRIATVVAALKSAEAKRVIDLGCGEGKLLGSLIAEKHFEEIVGMDVSHRSLERAIDRLKLDRLPPRIRERIRLFQGSLTYRDKRLSGFDAATVIEVIEHLDESRLRAFQRVLFEFACPRTVVVTTPNVEYNALFNGLPAGKFRHSDHRFEWTRDEFRSWTEDVAQEHGYSVRHLPVGTEDKNLGSPTQMAIFTLS
jgi:3' terminal RNA ribose 2'-O-methyltransferase Hen1